MNNILSSLPLDPDSLVTMLQQRAHDQANQRAFTYLVDGETEELHITYAELDRWARRIAARLQECKARGERVLLLYPAGLDYIAAFFGCLYAGCIAVPVYPPKQNRTMNRLSTILADAQPAIALTTTQILSPLQRRFVDHPEMQSLHWEATDLLLEGLEDTWRPTKIARDDLAFLQYTSGSTGSPKGVMVSHGNLLHNLWMIKQNGRLHAGIRGMSWLPLYHDMGLIGGVLLPLYTRYPMVLMSPVAFLQNPLRWLQAMTRYRSSMTVAPNFAFDLCTSRVAPEQAALLDLSSLSHVFNGAEPVSPETLEQFALKFAPSGFRRESFLPCYGLAEATLFVAAKPSDSPVTIRNFDTNALAEGRVVITAGATEQSRKLVSCGVGAESQRIAIVNPATRTLSEPGQVGEIWVAGLSMAQGYWQRADATEETFHAHLSPTGEGPFMRTGDLGCLYQGELFITGRLKDVIIIRGRNLYPQDIELTTRQCHPALSQGNGAAFSVDVAGKERLVIVQEITRQHRQYDTREIMDIVCRTVATEHEVEVYAVALLKTGSILKTSSGKIQRRANRQAFLDGTLEIISRWRADEQENESLVPEQQDVVQPEPEQVATASAHRNVNSTPTVVINWLVDQVASRARKSVQSIDIRAPFESYGLDSLAAVDISGAMERWLGRRLSPTLIYDYPNIEALANHIAAGTYAPLDTDRREPEAAEEPIAVIGMGCRFPGANSPEHFWQLLSGGTHAISEASPERLAIYAQYDPEGATLASARRAGFLDQVDQFDPRFFGISPREAIQMDPQQRLLLEVAWEALEQSALSPEHLAGTRTGVFIGISSNDYSRLPGEVTRDHDTYAATGNALSIAANRLSYLLNLHGPSMAIDTACSSSLVALHLACQSLRLGESEVALAGGVNLILYPQITQLFAQAQMMARDGLCKTFDASADGYVRGEGCGVVVLKPYSKAQQDGDPILALIRGSAINQDGHSNGLTAPRGPAQQEVIHEALCNAHVMPAQIDYVEVHGTGTPLGDPIEIQALGAVLQKQRSADAPCALGSVKTNIGHLEAAAGIAGFIKVVLALQHEAIPPHLHLKKVNPHIPLQTLPLTIPTRLQPWPRSDRRRLAGVSSFGFGGTNAHVIVEEGPIVSNRGVQEFQRPLHLLNISAQSQSALRELAQKYIEFGEHAPDTDLADSCFTANTGRAHFSHRLSVIAGSLPQLGERLQAFVSGKKTNGVRYGHLQNQQRLPVVWLFTGQGSQYVSMGRQLYETQSTFRHTLEQCAEILTSHLDVPLLSLLYPASGSSDLLHRTIYTQPVLFALEYSLARLWHSWGVPSDIVMGHSVGEYVAACVAGIFSLEDGLKLVAARGRLMQELTQEGQMVTVQADEAHVQQVLRPYQDQCAIAAINAPGHVVIAGTKDAIQAVSQQLSAENIEVQVLKVSHAFHSPLMEPMLDAFEQVANQVHYSAPRIPLVSSLSGQTLTETPVAYYWRDHLRQTVQFSAALSHVATTGEHIFLEIGPHPTLLTLGKRCLPEQNNLWLPSLKRGQEDWHTLLESLSALYTYGISLDGMGFDRHYARRRVPCLPTYPFERKRYWKEPARPEEHQAAQTPGYFQNSTLPATGQERGNLLMKEAVEIDTSRDTPALPQVPVPARKETILSTLYSIIHRLLQIAPDEIDPHAPLLELGADSLVLIDAVRAVEQTFGLKISVRLLFEELTTLDALATYVEQHALPDLFVAEHAHNTVAPITLESQLPVQSTIPAPLSVNGQAAPQSAMLERIMGHQLAIMEQQLEILRAGQTSQTTARQPAAGTPQRSVPSSSQPAVAVPLSRNGKEAFVPYQGKVVDKFQGLDEQQHRYLSAFIERYTQRTQRSRQLTQKTRSFLADVRGVAGFRFSIKEMLYPIMAERSQGARIWDVDGNEYIDISMGFGVHLFGHNVSFIVETLERQLKNGIPLGPQALLAGRVAELIHELTGMERVTFMNSGTEAVMTALRLARTATQRTKIALFAGSYHGSFDGVLARIEHDGEQAHVVPMAPGVPPHMIEDVLVLEYGDASSLDTIQAHAHELAAVLVEPVQSRRPDLQPAAFLHQLRAITAQTGVALIFDEMITGFRIQPGGAQTWFGVEADLATYGKIVGGGMPIGVVAGKAAYMDGVDGGMWQYGDASYPQAETTFFAGTFCKHPLAMAAACAVLEELKSRGASLQNELNQRTAYLANCLNIFFEEEVVPLRMVHFGSLFRFHFSGNMDLLFYHLIEKGFYIWEGRNCFLSTAHTDDDIESFIQAVKESIAEMRAGGFLPPAGPSGNGGQRYRNDVASLAPYDPLPTVPAPHTNGNEHVTSMSKRRSFPLTDAQKQLWVFARIGGDELVAYNESIAVELRGTFHLTAMQQAFQSLIERHEALRTTIRSQGDAQDILPTLTFELPLLDFSHIPSTEVETSLAQRLQEESQYRFDLTRGPLIRAIIIKITETRHLLQVTAHHIIIDGWSIGILLKEASELYSSICQGTPCHLESALQFADYVRWQEQQRQGEERKIDESYWLKQFEDTIPVLELPTDRPRPAVKTYNGARQSIKIDNRLYTRIKQASKRQGCTPFMFLFATYMTYIYRLTGQQDIVIGIPTAGRSLEKSENLIGYCVNMTPVRGRVDGSMPWIEHLAAIKHVLLEAYEHQEYPFSTLVKKLNPQRDSSRSPLVNVTFNMDRRVPVPPLFELKSELLTPPLRYTKFDLSLNIIEANGVLLVDLDYNTDLFEGSTMKRMLGHWQTLLEGVVSQPEAPLWALPLLSVAERQELLIHRNQTQAPYPRERCYHELFAEQAARTPEALAVCCAHRQLSYRELEQRANQLAAFLQQQQVGAGSVVGLCLERSCELVVSLLAILKAGAAFLPLDPAFPAERLSYMLHDAQVRVLLTQQALMARLPVIEGLTRLCVESQWSLIAQQPATPVASGVTGAHLAYVIYTSGSTGRPKGVLIPHQGLLNYLWWCLEAYTARQGWGAPVQSSIAADAIFPSLFAPLLVGGSVRLLPEEEPLAALASALQEQSHFSLIKITPSQLEVLTQHLPPVQSARQPEQRWVSTLVVGAEALRGDVLDYWQTAGCAEVVLNEYGPTETVVGCSIYRVPAGTLLRGAVPLGLPIANTQFYVLDAWMQVVPIGGVGELYIGGEGVAWGYLHRAELTAQVFVPDPFSAQPGMRLYKTGDLVRVLADGQANLEFVGRGDQQVKIRGYRVELAEVEATLVAHAQVQSAVVVAREEGRGGKHLVAYLLREPGQALAVEELRAYLHAQLPDYMVPGVFLLLESWPLTATGKLDVRALPVPQRADYEPSAELVEPRTPTERGLVEIWQRVLGLAEVGIADNFFEVGGDSILATQVVSAISSQFQVDFPLREFFGAEPPTISGIARYIEQSNQKTLLEQEQITRLLEQVRGLSDEEASELLTSLDN